ncbi:swr1 complex component, partial [Lunasporangiospora selenospora]
MATGESSRAVDPLSHESPSENPASFTRPVIADTESSAAVFGGKKQEQQTLSTIPTIEMPFPGKVKRGPGRPPRSSYVQPTSNGSPQESSTRPRRSLRSASLTTSALATVASQIPNESSGGGSTNGHHAETSEESNSNILDGDVMSSSAIVRASKRATRPPGKYLMEVSTATTSAITTAPPLSPSSAGTTSSGGVVRATPANQRPLLEQRARGTTAVGMRAAATRAGIMGHRPLHQQPTGRSRSSTGSPSPPPPPPPPIVPIKRGPGRPPKNPNYSRLGVPASSASSSTQAGVAVMAACATNARSKAKSASPIMNRGSGQTNGTAKGQSVSPSASSTPRSSISESSFSPPPQIRRGPGRPPKPKEGSHSSPLGAHWPGTVVSLPPPTPRSRKRHNKNDVEDEEGNTTGPSSGTSGFTPRKKRALSTQGSTPSTHGSNTTMTDMRPPKPLTPLDRAREAKVGVWEGKLHEVVDDHDTLVRELYHLETFTTMLTYDPVKNKADHSDRMLRFLRTFDLWSQVPELVSTVQLSTDRISTRRSAIEKREQLVDMLQRNVEGALPRRPDFGQGLGLGIGAESGLGPGAASMGGYRYPPHLNQQPLYDSLGDYLDSFVYIDDEEVSPEEADLRTETHASLLNRIAALKAEGRLCGKPGKPFVDPEVPKLQSNWLMEHIMTSSRLIKEEGKLQMARARKVSKMITKHFELLHGKSEREQRLEEKRVRRLAKVTSNEVKKKWRYVDGIVRARHKAMILEEQEEAGKRHLNLILEHSTQILEVQHSALNIGTPGTPGTPGAASSVVVTTSDVASLSSFVAEPSSRRSSIAPSSISAAVSEVDTDLDDNGADVGRDSGDTEFMAAEPEADDETTLANEESGSEDDAEEISGLQAEMDIPIEDLLKMYGYQLSGGEDSDEDDEDDVESGASPVKAKEQRSSKPEDLGRGKRRQRRAATASSESGVATPMQEDSHTNGSAADATVATPVNGTSSPSKAEAMRTSLDDMALPKMDVHKEPITGSMDIDSVEVARKEARDNNDTQELDELSNDLPCAQPSQQTQQQRQQQRQQQQPTMAVEGRRMSSKEIANALPEALKQASRPIPLADRSSHVSKRRRLSMSELYRGPPLPYNPYGEVDDERTLEEEEEQGHVDSDPEEIVTLLKEKDLPIETILDIFNYDLESSEYSDSYYDGSDWDEDESMSVMSSQQRIRRADPRYVVTLLDVAKSRKFPTRPSSEFTDTDTEYDDNRTISIYGTDDELSLGDMLPLLDPIVQSDREMSPDIDITTTGANVKTKIPFLLRHQLREYQHVGMDWLANLYANGLNGILADEMGLGKTMQTIALLAHLACDYGVWGPHLIVVPTSVMLNWEMEFKKWCPGFKIMTYYGNPRERKEKRVGWSRENAFHVCITSYQLVVQDQSVFRRKAWQYLILDEAHNIKNFRSQRWQTLLNFNSARRLLLTGTPLQNNLMELWSLLYFLMPNGVSQMMPVGFANQKEFQEWFSHPVDRMIEGNEEKDEDSKAAIARLHTVLRPYLLRRLKADVETQMPAKYEHIVYCRLSKRQRFLYDDFMSRAKTRETLASGNFLSIINCLMQLRKVCNHPDLFEVRPIVTSFAMPSAVAGFEITEFLVRRQILNEVDQARESANLEFLGLVFTGEEGRLSRMDTELLTELDASSGFRSKAAEFSAANAGGISVPTGASVQAKTLTNSGQYQDIRQYSAMRRHRHLQISRQRWEQLEYVNANRCRANIVYGSSVLNLCRAPIKSRSLTGGCARVLDQAENPREYMSYTNALAQAILPSAKRLAQEEETIKRFAFVTPMVLIRDYSVWGEPIVKKERPALSEVMYEQANELLHPIQNCLEIQFPDKRLLQFDCGKLQKLDSLLRELKSGGHRALIFTQMTKVLDILEIFLNIHGHRYLRLDGATKVENRQHLTDRFNSDPKILAFILSTRSGGVGINLTGADTVIFYDSDWNPSMDRQCQDRCHRIGQTRDVHIYRFVSEFTIEENMLKKANQKRMLDNVVIQEGGFTTDYFQKMDWRDMLGEDDLAKLG